MKRAGWIAALVIVGLAAALRIGWAGVVEFKSDEATLSRLALELARGERFPLLGMTTSIGVPNAPFNVYVMTLPFLFSSNPQIATQYVGLLNVLAVALTFWLTKRYYGAPAALIAALLYATSPWGVIFSRKIWAQDLLPFFTLLTLTTGLLGFVEGKRWAQAVHLPLLVITGQLHYAAFVLLPLSAYLLWIGRKHWTRTLIVGVIAAVVLCVPYALGIADYLASLTPGQATATLESAPSRSITLTPQGLILTAYLIGGADIHALAGAERYQEYLAGVPDVYPLFHALALLTIPAALWMMGRTGVKIGRSVERSYETRSFDDERAADAINGISTKRQSVGTTPVLSQYSAVNGLILLWLGIPIAAFSVTWTDLHLHYLLPMLPAAYIVLGAGAGALWEAGGRWRWGYVLAAAGALIVAGLQVWLMVALFNFLWGTPTPGGFGTPLGYLLPAREAVLVEQPPRVIVEIDPRARQITPELADAIIWDVLLTDVPDLQVIDPSQTRLYPAQPVQIVVLDCAADGAIFSLRDSNSCISVAEQTPRSTDELAADLIPVQARFANGVNLHGAGRADNRCVSLLWEITAPTNQNYSFAVSVLDADRNRAAQMDRLSLEGRYWRAGDRLLSRFCAADALPAAGARLVTGMYTYDGVTFNNMDVLDENGTPVGQTVEIALED